MTVYVLWCMLGSSWDRSDDHVLRSRAYSLTEEVSGHHNRAVEVCKGRERQRCKDKPLRNISQA